MHGSSLHPGAWREDRKGRHHPGGFSLLEMMMVVTVILSVASIAMPIYQTCATRAREAVLRDHLFALRSFHLPSPPRKRGSTRAWIPAFAGMTSTWRPRPPGRVGRERLSG
jgi:prepilin-type N-terminal cleavage/methylation domain-containing protein